MPRILAFLVAATCLAAADHVVVIGVDGLGSAGLRASGTPRIDELKARGAWTLQARAVIPTVSSPNWASMIMGAGPAQHGVTSNDWQPDKYDIAPVCRGPAGVFPTMFGLLREQRPSSNIGVFHHWKGYARLVEPRAATRMEHLETAPATAEAAIAYWREHRPSLLFVHLDEVDHAGHDHGWASGEYRAAVAEADTLIGRIVDAVDIRRTLVLVTADHGGMGTKHGGLTMAELEIPWILAGPGVKPGELRVPVNTWDTAGTVAYALKLKPPSCWIARHVAEAFR